MHIYHTFGQRAQLVLTFLQHKVFPEFFQHYNQPPQYLDCSTSAIYAISRNGLPFYIRRCPCPSTRNLYLASRHGLCAQLTGIHPLLSSFLKLGWIISPIIYRSGRLSAHNKAAIEAARKFLDLIEPAALSSFHGFHRLSAHLRR